MSRLLNGQVFVPSFSPTEVPGEFTFTNGIFNNQADATGNAAFDAKVGDKLFIPAADANTYVLVPGVVHRFRITALEAVDAATINATVRYDEPGELSDVPANGSFCLYAQASAHLGFGAVPSDAVYPELPVGSSVSALVRDFQDIADYGSLQLRLLATTTDAAVTYLSAENKPFVALDVGRSYVFVVDVQGVRQDVPDQECAFRFTGSVKRDRAGTVILGGVLKNIFTRTVPEWDSAVGEDNTNGGLTVAVVGSQGAILNWQATVTLTASQ